MWIINQSNQSLLAACAATTVAETISTAAACRAWGNVFFIWLRLLLMLDGSCYDGLGIGVNSRRLVDGCGRLLERLVDQILIDDYKILIDRKNFSFIFKSDQMEVNGKFFFENI